MIATHPESEVKPPHAWRSLRPLHEANPGEWMHALAAELYPTCRSITGEGLRTTLRRIQREIPIAIHEVPSGTPVLDWTIPPEWNVREAWIENARSERVVDFRAHNLHVVNYSEPVRARLTLGKLRPHLHSLPEHPDWIPYRTSYYKRDWGFCLAHRQLQQLTDGEYDVHVDSTLSPGALSYGELVVPGESEEEFLISTHSCHPSLANDNLSGVVVAVALAKSLLAANVPRLKHSVRFLFLPGTIGAIAWLARNESNLHRIQCGLVLTCVGDEGAFTYKRSRRGEASIDQLVASTLRARRVAHRVIDFTPFGYDERQYCSPGFNLPVGCLMRSQHGTFPEYHTSADDLAFIKAERLAETLDLLEQVLRDAAKDEDRALATRLEPHSRFTPRASRSFVNQKPKGEPQLGKYDLYAALANDVKPALWLLNFSDGAHSLEEIAIRSGQPFDKLARAADILVKCGLLKEVEP